MHFGMKYRVSKTEDFGEGFQAFKESRENGTQKLDLSSLDI